MLSMVGLVESHDEIAMKNQAMSEQERRAQVRPYLLRRFGHAAAWTRGGSGTRRLWAVACLRCKEALPFARRGVRVGAVATGRQRRGAPTMRCALTVCSCCACGSVRRSESSLTFTTPRAVASSSAESSIRACKPQPSCRAAAQPPP